MALIHEKIIAAMKDTEAIGKNSKNVTQNFKFRGIDDVYNSLHPILASHELFTVPKILEDRTEERQTRSGGTLIYRMLKIEYTVYTSDGSSVSSVVIGEGMDSGDKGASKAMSIAHKNFLIQLFCIPTTDLTDPDKDSYEVAGKDVKDTIATCDALIETAVSLPNLKQAVQYCLGLMQERNTPEEEVNKFRTKANQLREKFKTKEEVNNETK